MKSCPGLSVNPVRHSTRQAVYARCAWKQFAEHGRDKNERTSLTSSTMRISSLSSSKVTCHEMPLSNMSHLETCWIIDFFVNFCGLISLYIIPAWIAWTFRSWSLHRRGQRANHDWTPACEEENQVSCEDSYVAGFESIEGNFRRIWAVQEGLKTEDWSHSNGSNSTNQIKFKSEYQ